MFLADAVLNTLIEKLTEAVWNRPELARLRRPIEAALRGDEFKRLTRDAFQTYTDRTRQPPPPYFDDAFVQQGPVQDALTAYIIEGRDADLDELLRRYRDHMGDDSDAARAALTAYLGYVRETFAAHPAYGPVLLARDMDAMLDAIGTFRQEVHDRLDEMEANDRQRHRELLDQLNRLLQEPELEAMIARKQGRHVFLSYSRLDRETADTVRKALETAGHTVWQDTTTIKGGEEWIASIEDGIDRAYTMVTLVSAASNNSKWVRLEFLQALRREKHIIPLKIDDDEIPMMMLDLNVIFGDENLGAGIEQVLAALLAPESPSTEAPPQEAPASATWKSPT